MPALSVAIPANSKINFPVRESISVTTEAGKKVFKNFTI